MERTTVVIAPNPEKPDEIFSDGDFAYEVSLWPAMFPVRYTQDTGAAGDVSGELFYVLYTIVFGAILHMFDRRVKVVVSRKPNRRMTSWSVVGVSFYPDGETAENARRLLLSDWRSKEWAEAFPMSATELRHERLKSKSA